MDREVAFSVLEFGQNALYRGNLLLQHEERGQRLHIANLALYGDEECIPFRTRDRLKPLNQRLLLLAVNGLLVLVRLPR